jgi:hypothetical protein
MPSILPSLWGAAGESGGEASRLSLGARWAAARWAAPQGSRIGGASGRTAPDPVLVALAYVLLLQRERVAEEVGHRGLRGRQLARGDEWRVVTLE